MRQCQMKNCKKTDVICRPKTADGLEYLCFDHYNDLVVKHNEAMSVA